MSQNQLVMHTPSQTLFPLNIKAVSELFPGFAEGDFAVFYGSPSILSLTSLLCVRAQLPTQLGGLKSNVVFVDGGNTFRLYQIAKLAQLHQLNPREVLGNIYVSRAFTAYQLTNLIMQQLKAAIKKYNAKLVIISDVAGFFLDADIPDDEAQRIFSQVMAFLSYFARENRIILITAYLPNQETKRNLYLQTLAFEKASVILSLRETKQAKEFLLEKHPCLKLGLAKLPSENTTLTDFIEDSA